MKNKVNIVNELIDVEINIIKSGQELYKMRLKMYEECILNSIEYESFMQLIKKRDYLIDLKNGLTKEKF